jgi:ATP-dependent Clp protease ATP-binding subunit ClpA
MRLIVRIQARRLERKLGAQNMTIVLSDALLEQLATAGYDPALGARPLRGEIRKRIERPLSRLIIDGTFAGGDTVLADVDADGAVTFAKAEDAAPDLAATEPTEDPVPTEPDGAPSVSDASRAPEEPPAE